MRSVRHPNSANRGFITKAVGYHRARIVCKIPACVRRASGRRAILFPGSKFAETRHPRTAVGIDASGRQLILLVVDGRQPELSIGMTLAELSAEMIHAGCVTAINLDGGGSTTLVYRDAKTKKLAVLNSPSDFRERAVAEVLGVTY